MAHYKVDRMNLVKELGQERIEALSTEFYNRVYGDEDPEWYQDFGVLFVGRSKERAIANQWHFFVQRFGGPPLYTQNRSDDAYGGHPALRARHRFKVNARGAERWMYHMKNAMLAQGFVEGEETYEALHEFFAEVAQFLRNK